MSARAVRNSEFKQIEIDRIEQHYGIKFNRTLVGYEAQYVGSAAQKQFEKDMKIIVGYANKEIHNLRVPNQFEIVYWQGLPEDMKLSYITSIHLDWELITEDWKVNPDNLRVVPMMGNRMNSWPQPIKNNDVCIIDTSDTDLNNDGIYFFTTNEGKNLFICKLSKRIDGSLIASWHENGIEDSRVITTDEQKEVGLVVIGRVIKNLSMVL